MWEDFWMNAIDWLMKWFLIPIAIIICALLVLAIPFIIYNAVHESNCCSKWENRIVHQDAFTTYVMVGKIMIPQYHPSGDYYKNVCVKHKDNCTS